jgi:hypothetical protein
MEDDEPKYKLIIHNGNDVKEFICEIESGVVFSEERIDDTSRFNEGGDFVEYDFYSTDLDDILEKNKAISITKLNKTIPIN